MLNNNTFPRAEKLKSRKLLGKVFDEGKHTKAFPIRLQYLIHEEETPADVQATFVVSKRLFKRAVDRNRLKRQMREAYRLNKPSLLTYASENNIKIALVFIYMPNEKFEYAKIEKGVIKLLDRVQE